MSENKIYVAVVDDDESFSKAICRLLRAAGFQPVAYPSAEAFLVPTPFPPPACLVLDIQLGGMSGLELQQRLGELGSAPPIIFVTAHGGTSWLCGLLAQTFSRAVVTGGHSQSSASNRDQIMSFSTVIGPLSVTSNQ